MKLSIKALALAAGILWGGAILFVSVIQMMSPDYGVQFLNLVASVYPGYQAGAGAGSVVTGTLYGFADGAIGGAIFAWLYNVIAGKS